MTEKNNIYIEDVVDVKELQTLQDNWAKATDLAFVTVDCNGTPITKQSNFTPFCKRLRELDAFREKCYYCDACGGRKARRIGKAYVYICHAGLIDFAIPIMIKGQYVGAFLAGQVTSTDFADLKKITTQSEDWKDNQELVELYSQVKEVSVEKIEAVAHARGYGHEDDGDGDRVGDDGAYEIACREKGQIKTDGRRAYAADGEKSDARGEAGSFHDHADEHAAQAHPGNGREKAREDGVRRRDSCEDVEDQQEKGGDERRQKVEGKDADGEDGSEPVKGDVGR